MKFLHIRFNFFTVNNCGSISGAYATLNNFVEAGKHKSVLACRCHVHIFSTYTIIVQIVRQFICRVKNYLAAFTCESMTHFIFVFLHRQRQGKGLDNSLILVSLPT